MQVQIQLTMLVYLMLISPLAAATPIGSLTLPNDIHLEAVSPCASGRCLASLMVPGANEVAAQSSELLQSINIFKKDTRVVQERKGKSNPFSAIGQIKTVRDLDVIDENGKVTGKGKGKGTAWMVSPCYVMTNYHVVFGTLSRQDVIPYVKALNQQMKSSNPSEIKIPSDRNFTMSFSYGEKPDGSYAKVATGYPVAFGGESAMEPGHSQRFSADIGQRS